MTPPEQRASESTTLRTNVRSPIARQLALTLVREIIARKQQQHTVPSHALNVEITKLLTDTFADLVADGSLLRHDTLNNIAYALPRASCK